jgi:UDP-N-acetylmuramoyl-tripeptide--D-alanyl-D-alanine ligase
LAAFFYLEYFTMNNIGDFYSSFFTPGNICTDTRKISKGDIFIALKGENFDGNLYVNDALKSGASVAVTDNPSFHNVKNTILVRNSLQFLHELAIYHKHHIGFHVLAITGTNGKTTTKELIRSVLSEKYKCQATEGNLNNHIGVPISLLAVQNDTQYAIIEMGANHQGEIKILCEIAHPDSGLITNIGKAHLEGFGSFEGVKKTKSELYDYIKENSGTIFFNASNKILTDLIGSYQIKIPYNPVEEIKISVADNSPTLAVDLDLPGNLKFKIKTNLYGGYNLENILAAVCIGLHFGLNTKQIKDGIEKYRPNNNRSQIQNTQKNTLVIDCYNANPTSMDEAIRSFEKLNSPSKILILGGMKELGEYSETEHLRLIDLLKKLNFEEIILTGEEFNIPDNHEFKYFPDLQKLSEYLQKVNYRNKQILIKGSRANKLEKIIEYL